MPESRLNCQHLPNPEPLRLVRRMVASGPPQPFQVVVDNLEARSDVSSFLLGQGYAVKDAQHNGLWILKATPEVIPLKEENNYIARQARVDQECRVLVILLSSTLGRGDETLGENLMHIFIRSLSDFGNNLWRIALINSAVKLASLNSPVLHYLQDYERNGVGILVCKECVFHYGLQNYSTVGAFCDVHNIISSVQLADRVLRF